MVHRLLSHAAETPSQSYFQDNALQDFVCDYIDMDTKAS